MQEPSGVLLMPADAPAELKREHATHVFTPDHAEGLQIGAGWAVRDGAWAYDGHEESHLRLTGLHATEFDLWVELEAVNSACMQSACAIGKWRYTYSHFQTKRDRRQTEWQQHTMYAAV